MRKSLSTGDRITGEEREKIITACALGKSERWIARKFQHARDTIAAIRDREFDKIEQRKPMLAAQAEYNAFLSGNRLTRKLESDEDIPLNLLVPVYGVSVDKTLALRGDVPIQRHEHIHLTGDDLIAFAVARSRRSQAAVVEVPALQPRDTSVRGENGAQKEG